MAEHEVSIPGVAGRVTVTEPGFVRGAQILVDGQPAPKAGMGKFWLTRSDGSRVEARFAGGLTASLPSVVVDGVSHDVGPKIPLGLVVLTFLPFTLMLVGGALGGMCGGVGWAVNGQIARGSWPMAAKVGAMFGVTAVSVGVFAVLAALFQLAIRG